MAPGGQDADEQEDQDDNQDNSQSLLLLSSFSFQTLSLLTRFQDVLGTAHVLLFYQTGVLFPHKQPRNLCNNKSESFSISFHLRPFIVIGHSSFSATRFTWLFIEYPITSSVFPFLHRDLSALFAFLRLFQRLFQRASVLSAFRFVFVQVSVPLVSLLFFPAV